MNVLELEPLRSIRTTIGGLYDVVTGDPNAAYRAIEEEWIERERVAGEIADLEARLSIDGNKVIELARSSESSVNSAVA